MDSLCAGILDIVWRSNLGERGHLQTSPLQTMVILMNAASKVLNQLYSTFNFYEFAVHRSRQYTVVVGRATKYRIHRETFQIHLQAYQYIVSYSLLRLRLYTLCGQKYNYVLFQFSSDSEITVTLCLEEMKNLIWCDTSGRQLEKIPPHEHIQVQLHLIPLDIGLQVSSEGD